MSIDVNLGKMMDYTNPTFKANMKAKRKRELKASVKALYAISPILWAVVKGYDTPERIATRFEWTESRTNLAIRRAINDGLIHVWEKKLRPTQHEHKLLRRRLLQ